MNEKKYIGTSVCRQGLEYVIGEISIIPINSHGVLVAVSSFGVLTHCLMVYGMNIRLYRRSPKRLIAISSELIGSFSYFVCSSDSQSFISPTVVITKNKFTVSILMGLVHVYPQSFQGLYARTVSILRIDVSIPISYNTACEISVLRIC